MSLARRKRSGRHLAAILAADLAGYARLMSEDEEPTLAALRSWRNQVADPRIRAHRGRIIKSTGDGFLVEFASVVDAVRCAVEMQREMTARNANVPVARRLEFRIGVNLGDIVAEDHDIFGDGVNIAARLEGLAEPGGICISRVVRDQIRDKLSYAFEDRGEQQVKNIARPVRVYAMSPALIAATELAAAPARRRIGLGLASGAIAAIVVAALAGVGVWRLWHGPVDDIARLTAAAPAVATAPTTAGPPRLSIIVLPFENLSHDP
ncbi:MAG TPA: adenylate/guanylate cyclase domain-containing protein, partial [Caldimonas sp.]|nr:adenylate/guanylate cyclase domain-containing protein [Caldimonas sp.]